MMTTKVKCGTLIVLIAIAAGIALYLWQTKLIHEFETEPVRSVVLGNGCTYRIWKDVLSDDRIPFWGLPFLLDDQSFTGEINCSGRRATWSFDIISDFPPDQIEVWEEDGKIVIKSVGGERTLEYDK
jgi:hypothetical protein